jgi:hypothetical protein
VIAEGTLLYTVRKGAHPGIDCDEAIAFPEQMVSSLPKRVHTVFDDE